MLNGFGRFAGDDSAQAAARLSGGGSGEALRLAGRYPYAFFLTPEGECFHNATVTGGKPASEGPLALKRELREAEGRLGKLESELAQAETEAAALAGRSKSMAAQLETLSEERRQAERDTANQGAALKQMEAEAQRVERRLAGVDSAGGAQQGRARGQATVDRRRSARRCCAWRQSTARPRRLSMSCRRNWTVLRQTREGLQQEAAQVTAELAGLEERRRGAEAAFQRIDRLHADLERRVLVYRAAARRGPAETRAAR